MRAVRLCAILLASAGLASCGNETAEAPPEAVVTPPAPTTNLLLICIDTVGAENFFSDRLRDPLTPWLESAQQYRDASAAAPWTIPSVSTTLTGLYPVQHRAGQFENEIANLDVDLPSALSDETETLAEVLAGAGFATGAFSAHPWFAADFGFDQGFEELHLRKGWQKVLERHNEWLGALPVEQRFFGYLHFMEAHDWHAKAEHELTARLETLDPGLLAELRAASSDAACADPDAVMCQRNMVYNLAVRESRKALAAVLEELRRFGRLHDTLVVVYSDHGEEFWQHREEHRRRGDPRGFFGYGHGQSLYQELLNVPLLAWHPNAAGVTHTTPVSLVDVFPTVLEWLEVKAPDRDLPGLPLPLGPNALDRPKTTLYASGIAYGPRAIATRTADEKSIFNRVAESFEHYDLALDPGEKRPIADHGRTMQADVLAGDYLDLGSAAVAYRPELDAEQLEQLKSIGYLQGVDEPPPPSGAGTNEALETEEPPEAEEEP